MSASNGRPWRATCVVLAVCLAAGYLTEVVPRYSYTLLAQPAGPAAVHHTFLYGDCRFYRTTVRSILSDGDVDLRDEFIELAAFENPPPGARPEHETALGRGGQWYPKHPLLLPFVAAPFYLLGGEPGLLYFNVLQLVALGIVVWLCARRHAPDGVALAVTFWVAFGTLLRPVAYNFSPDVLSTLLVLSTFLALVSGRASSAGVLVGLALWAKWSNVVLLPVAGLFAFVAWPTWRFLRFGLAASVVVVGLLAVNGWMFGSPFLTPYDRVIVGFHDGQPVLGDFHRTLFDVPFWRGLWTQLVDRHVPGLLFSGPPVLLLLPGLVPMFRRRAPEALLLLGICLAQIVFYAPYRPWHMSNFGHRFLMPVVALSAIPAGALLAWLLPLGQAPALPADRPRPGALRLALGLVGATALLAAILLLSRASS